MDSTFFIVTPKFGTPGVTALQNAARTLGRPTELLLAEHADTPLRLERAIHVVYRMGPISFSSYTNLLAKMHPSKARKALSAVLAAFDKCIAYDLLSRANVPSPHSVIVTGPSKSPMLPVVIKPPVGNRGGGVKLIQTEQEFAAQSADYIKLYGRFLAQEYIPESKGSDKRLIVVRGQVVSAMQRFAAKGDFRANLHQGGTALPYESLEEERHMAVKACEALDLNFAGVDIIDSKSGPMVLEVNPSPGFGISEVSGKDVAKEVIEKLTR